MKSRHTLFASVLNFHLCLIFLRGRTLPSPPRQAPAGGTPPQPPRQAGHQILGTWGVLQATLDFFWIAIFFILLRGATPIQPSWQGVCILIVLMFPTLPRPHHSPGQSLRKPIQKSLCQPPSISGSLSQPNLKSAVSKTSRKVG